jgi:hypothetical protein
MVVIPEAVGQESAGVEEQIWALEEAYISAFENAKHDQIISMLHTGFLGWPRESVRPSEKSDVALFLSENYPEPLGYRFELDRAGIRVSGNVAITHYLVVIRAKDEIRSGPSQTIRLTHTWIKAGADWQILGGMSSTVPVSSR